MDETGSSKGQSRRGFLKALGVAGAAAVMPAAQASADSRGELATLHDLSKCIGCGACVEACRESNVRKFPEPEKPFPRMLPRRVKVADWSDKRDVDDRLTPYNWLYIQTAEVEHNGERVTVHIPRRCMHCQNPPCANLCPWGAAGQQANGIVRIDPRTCIGGAKCRTVCPWKIPQRQTGVGLYLDLLPELAGNGVMFKCDRCYDRIAQGELPACVEICPLEVQTIGPRDEIVARAHALAKEINGHIYGETENGGTNTIYVSPVPFEKLDAAIEKDAQKGRPHLSRTPNSMERAENLTAALFVAPLAGVAGGLLRAGSVLAKSHRAHGAGAAAHGSKQHEGNRNRGNQGGGAQNND